MGTFRKIILIAVQDEASSLFRDILQKALLRVGGKKPIWPWYRGSFVLVAYSGADSQPCMDNTSGKAGW